MKILHIMTTLRGGAGGASLKILRALEGSSEHRVLYGTGELVMPGARKVSVHSTPIMAHLARLQFSLARKGVKRKNDPFSPTRTYRKIEKLTNDFRWADILQLHWIGGFHFDLHSVLMQVPTDMPVVITMHDMEHVTGGCHYSNGCELYCATCQDCPQLPHLLGPSLSRSSYQAKAALYERLQPTLVTPSHWLKGVAEKSSLGKKAKQVVNIGYPHPKPGTLIPRVRAEELLGIQSERQKRILLIAQDLNDPRKGFRLIAKSIKEGRLKDFSVVTAGKTMKGLDDSIQELGFISDSEKMAAAYAAADVFCLSSLEENLAQTGMESLSQGTPVVCFSGTGPCDYTRTGQTGVVVSERSSAALSDGLRRALSDSQLACRNTIQARFRSQWENEYSDEVIRSAYTNLYESIL